VIYYGHNAIAKTTKAKSKSTFNIEAILSTPMKEHAAVPSTLRAVLITMGAISAMNEPNHSENLPDAFDTLLGR
jgi:hypothetical protein